MSAIKSHLLEYPPDKRRIYVANRVIYLHELRRNLTVSMPEEFWNSLHDGKIGIKPITKFDASEIPVFNAGRNQDFPFIQF